MLAPFFICMSTECPRNSIVVHSHLDLTVNKKPAEAGLKPKISLMIF